MKKGASKLKTIVINMSKNEWMQRGKIENEQTKEKLTSDDMIHFDKEFDVRKIKLIRF